jgi:hypothetical protein
MRGMWAAASLLIVAFASLTAALRGQGAKGLADEARRHGWLLTLAAGQEQARLRDVPLMVVLRCEP